MQPKTHFSLSTYSRARSSLGRLSSDDDLLQRLLPNQGAPPQHQHHHQHPDDHHRSAIAVATAATINALHLLGATDEHGAPLFRCHRCGRAYKTKYTCRRHERVECGLPAMYSCSLCNYRAKHKHSVKQHFDCVHKKKLSLDDYLKTDMRT